jgi:hypothetical protein
MQQFRKVEPIDDAAVDAERNDVSGVRRSFQC